MVNPQVELVPKNFSPLGEVVMVFVPGVVDHSDSTCDEEKSLKYISADHTCKLAKQGRDSAKNTTPSNLVTFFCLTMTVSHELKDPWLSIPASQRVWLYLIMIFILNRFCTFVNQGKADSVREKDCLEDEKSYGKNYEWEFFLHIW